MKQTSVLLIEDNERNRYLISFLLQKSGYHVVTANDGPSGIELAQSTIPDFILLDIQLPHMSGYEVAQALRQITSLKNSCIIAVTSFAMLGDRKKALLAGCDGYIEKPIDPDTFITSIESFRRTSTPPS